MNHYNSDKMIRRQYRLENGRSVKNGYNEFSCSPYDDEVKIRTSGKQHPVYIGLSYKWRMKEIIGSYM